MDRSSYSGQIWWDEIITRFIFKYYYVYTQKCILISIVDKN